MDIIGLSVWEYEWRLVLVVDGNIDGLLNLGAGETWGIRNCLVVEESPTVGCGEYRFIMAATGTFAMM